MAAADLVPTLADLRASTAQVIDATGLAFDVRQVAATDDVNVGSEVRLYGFTPQWDFDYEVGVAALRNSWMDPVIAVYDTTTGVRLATADDVSPSDSSSRLTLPLIAGQRYTLAVTSFDTATVGPYDVAIRAALEDDIREDDDAPVRGVATRIPQPENASFSGVMADASDCFSFQLDGPARAGSSLSLDFDSALGDLDMVLMGSSGRVLARSEGTTDRETILVGGLAPGTYFVDVYGYGGASNPSYTLTSAIRSGSTRAAVTADRFERNNTRASATNLGDVVATSEVTGLTLGRRDVDFFRFTLPSPGTDTSDIVVSFDAALGDIDAQLLDASGRRLAIAAGVDDTERLSLAGRPAGTYFLRVYGYRGASNPDYAVRFNQGTAVDPPVTLPSFGDPLPPPPAPPPAPTNPVGDWTIAVYMTSTDLADFAFDDINEMELAVSRFAPGAAITVFWDQWRGKSFPTGSQAAWDTAGRAVIAPDTNLGAIATEFQILPEQNTGDPAVLKDFLTWTMEVRPATRYGVVMWDHGGGLSGVNFDDESGYDSITVQELRKAIGDAGMSPSALMYDACLMGNIEQFYELRTVAPVQVASEEVISGPGYDYKTAFATLESAPAAVTPEMLARGVVDSFTTQYGTDGASTLAAVSSAGMTAVATAIKAFADSTNGFSEAQWSRLRALVGQVTRFEFPQYVDLGQLMERVSATSTFGADARSAAAAVVSAIGEAVFARMSDERQTSGMSIYFPTTASQEMAEVSLYTEWNSIAGWSRVVNRSLGRAGNARGGGAGGLWAFAERRK
ncbi:MAG: clostripain-related cysteine peptidase [Planctomycetaceae bacterium]